MLIVRSRVSIKAAIVDQGVARLLTVRLFLIQTQSKFDSLICVSFQKLIPIQMFLIIIKISNLELLTDYRSMEKRI